MSTETAAHALLSASGARRWLVCTPSARAEEHVQEESSEYADEGTHAHQLAEVRLAQALGERRRLPNGFKESEYYGPAMEDHVADFTTLVMERVSAHRAQGGEPVVLLEQKLDFSRWVPEGFGTGDVVIISQLGVEVIDLKYGQGVPVSAVDNPQTRLYGLGALDTYGMIYDLDRVFMTIVQPRLDSISTEELEATELLTWAEMEVRPRAQEAWEGKGEFAPGEHCRFCRVKATCRARAEANLSLAQMDFAKPATLSPEEIADVLTQLERDFKAWVKDVETYALDQAVNHGVRFPGWKVVEGRSNRQYADEGVVEQNLLNKGLEHDAIAPRKLLGITAMERLLGKKAFSELNDLVVKPAGKPTLAPESDKRPEINAAEAAARDFAEAVS